MDPRRLADLPDSALGRLLRYQLAGLRASLEAALADHPDDPGRDAFQALLDEVATLLTSVDAPRSPEPAPVPGSGAGPESGPEPAPAPVGTRDLDLEALFKDFSSAPEVREHLGDMSAWGPGASSASPPAFPAPSGGPGEVWRRFHLACLRLPPACAAAWRERTEAARQRSGLAADGPWRCLPHPDEEVLVPPLDGAAGLRTAPDAPLDAEVADSLGLSPDASLASWPAVPAPAGGLDVSSASWPASPAPAGGRGRPPDGPGWTIAALATTILALTEADEDLWLALWIVRFQGLAALTDAQTRTAYRRALLLRCARLRRAAPGSVEAFEPLLEVDEALSSVVHRPPAAPGSWWADLGERSRALVFDAEKALTARGEDVSVRLLARGYPEVRALTDGNDVRLRVAGRTGDVLACLRLWAHIQGKDLPGRVIYGA